MACSGCDDILAVVVVESVRTGEEVELARDLIGCWPPRWLERSDNLLEGLLLLLRGMPRDAGLSSRLASKLEV